MKIDIAVVSYVLCYVNNFTVITSQAKGLDA